MSKRSAYAVKHAEDNVLSSWAAENKDLWQIFEHPYDFESIFLKLPYGRQLEFLKTLQSIQNGRFDAASPYVRGTLESVADEFFQKIQWMTDSSFESGNGFYPLADDEKRLLRMECYGTIDERKTHHLSSLYKFFLSPEQRKNKYKLKEYDLMKGPMWRVFNQFESFRAIALKIKRYMYKIKLNPEALKIMSVNDFCDIIFKTFDEKTGVGKARFLKTPIKNKFVKDFMKKYGDDFQSYLERKGIDKRLVFSLRHAMEKYGVCDPMSISPIDTHFTERILTDLQKRKYDVEAFKVGDAIPLAIIDELLDKDEGHLLAARDEDGKILNRSVLPKFEVHHADGVQFAHSDSGGKRHYERWLAQANYPNSLMLVESNLHRLYYHGYDSVIRAGNNTELYFSRINSNNPFLVMINGFNSEDQIYADLQNNAAFRRREQEDKANVANYFEMQTERLHNIQDMSRIYRVPCSSQKLSIEINELQGAVKLDSDLSEDVVNGLAKWLSQVKKSKKQERKARKGIVVKKNRGRE